MENNIFQDRKADSNLYSDESLFYLIFFGFLY